MLREEKEMEKQLEARVEKLETIFFDLIVELVVIIKNMKKQSEA